MSNTLQTAEQIQQDWASNPRWTGITRNYTAADVVRLRGTVHVEHSLADDLAAWTQLENECADLRVDTYARNEVKQSIHRVTANISLRLADLRVPGQGTDGVIWWHLGERLDITSGRQLNQQLSTILDDLYAPGFPAWPPTAPGWCRGYAWAAK
ncbi:hypothetical protein QUF31_21550 [Dickeya chrysanthemi]|nr:hypothetical protein [Dickeya chrysanthemi]WJM85531.1 hypothetical protein QUF31_21550 [Dickeya chrysanthemi]